MIHLKNKTVGDIVTENVNTAKIFHKYQIDFGFNGDMILKKVCKKKKLDLDAIVSELNAVNKNKYYLKDYKNWKLNLLVSFLIDIHHNHKQDDILLLKKLAIEVSYKYSNFFINNTDLVHTVISISDDLLVKMNYEETIIYPHIKKLVAINAKPKRNIKIQPVLSENLDTVEKQRLIISEKFKKIILFTNDFKVPKDVCKTFQLFYQKLKKFQFYLQEHNHIEKNILLPKALELEEYIIYKI
jgi:regulator of cell morphogenesis and NO signaling